MTALLNRLSNSDLADDIATANFSRSTAVTTCMPAFASSPTPLASAAAANLREPAPASLADCVRDSRLKESNLVRMRKQLQGFLASTILIGSTRQRFDEWSSITKNSQLSLVKQVLHFRHARMKAVRATTHRRYR